MTSVNKRKAPLILGISASHNGAACLLRGSDVLVAIQEERLTRVKRKNIVGSQPALSIEYCFQSANVRASDLDLIVVCVQGPAQSDLHDASRNPQLKNRRKDVDIVYVPHHLCHAISVYATSGMSHSDILVIDGAGSPREDLFDEEQSLLSDERESVEALSCYQADGRIIKPLLKQMRSPANLVLAKNADGQTSHPAAFRINGIAKQQYFKKKNKEHAKSPVIIGSLGSMFEAVSLIIFGERMQAGKVMGLAAYGKPSIPVEEFLNWKDGQITYSHQFVSRFKDCPIWPERAADHQDLASSVQQALEYAVLNQLSWLRQQTQGENLCYAGGVALNTLLNERIIRESGYKEVYIIPAAEDSGTAIGAAYCGLWELTGEFQSKPLRVDSLGHNYGDSEITSSLASLPGIASSTVPTTDRNALLDEAVERLRNGDIGGWFQGGCELGPRALGQRSMLCDPRSASARDYLNSQVKQREAFRPFAPIVLAEHAKGWFDFANTQPHSPFMLRVANALPHAKDKIPAVLHIDGSARVQTVCEHNGLLYSLLQRFYAATDVPVLLNTSFNVAGEPIVETPEDAWRCMQTTPLSFCVLNNQMMTKKEKQRNLLDLVPTNIINRYSIDKDATSKQTSPRVSISTTTPWGELKSNITMHYFCFLNMADGKRSGNQIMRALRLEPGNSEHRLITLDALRVLHQFHALSFTE